jgi:hypothetical protein
MPVSIDKAAKASLRRYIKVAGPDGARKGDDRCLGMARMHGVGDAYHRFERPAEELLFGQHASPGIEELHGVGAGVDLVDEMIDHGIDQKIDQDSEGIGMAIGPSP